MPNPFNERKITIRMDSFFKEKPRPQPAPIPEPGIGSKIEPLKPDYPDLRHLEAHFETLDQEPASFRGPRPSFLSLEDPSEEAKEWHDRDFIPQRPKDPKPEDLRALIKRLLESDQWHYFLEHLGDFGSEENRLLRNLLKDKFDLSLLLHDLDTSRWEGFLDIIKFQPWFREKLLRNGIDLQALMLDFPDEPMKVLRAFKEDFIQASTEQLQELNAIMNQLNAKERDELLFEIIGIDKLCDHIKNATQLARFLTILTEDEFSKFLKEVDKKWLEGVMGSSQGLATVLDHLKKASKDGFDRVSKFLDECGGLDWLKDCLLFDRFRDISGLLPCARSLSEDQLRELLLNKIGLTNLPYVTFDFATMLIVLHGVPPGLHADLALAMIRENMSFGLTIIENAADLVKLLTAFKGDTQEKFFKDLSQTPGQEWLRTLTPTLSELTQTIAPLEEEVQTQIIMTLFKTEEIITQASTLTDKNEFLTLWEALPQDFPYASLLENIEPEKMLDFFNIREVPALIWDKIEKLEDLIQLTEALPLSLRSDFLFSPESVKTLQELVSKSKEPEPDSPTLERPRETLKSFFSSRKEQQPSSDKASLKALEKLLPDPEDKKKLQEILNEAPNPNLKSSQSK